MSRSSEPRSSYRGRSRLVSLASVVALAVMATACGTRVDDSDGSSALAVRKSDAAPAASGVGSAPAVEGSVDAGPAASAVFGTVASAPQATTPRRVAEPGMVRNRETTSSPGTKGPSTPAAGGVPTAAGQSAPSPGAAGGAAVQPAVPKGDSPVVLSSVGTYSGVPGTNLAPMVQGAQIWVKHINQKGGLNGHPVKLNVYDDGADPARHRAQVQEAVERQKTIAFLMNAEALTGQASVEYLESKGVPVIGLTTVESWAFSSPMYFPQAATSTDLYRTFSASTGARMAATGLKKVGTLNCVESEECTHVEEVFAADAKLFGYEHVYKAKASLAQPDYTAECLAARNAGVEFFFVNLIQTGTRRVAAACARQGYRPPMGTSAPGQADSQKDDPNLEGLLVASHVFPYFQSGTPATDEFQAAMRAYGSGVQAGVGPAMGWVAGKVLDKAGARLAEPPTSAGILAGLWSLKQDTLGGLTMPLTFIEHQPPPHQSCWWDMHVSKGHWVSPDQYTMHCRSGQ